MNKVDLLLGGSMGLWSLQNVSIADVKQVLTLDHEIATTARNRGLTVWTEKANLVDYIPSTVGLSVHYPCILKQELISRYQKIYNLHSAYLPWGRGYYPVFWALWEQTIAGATLHELTEHLDSGPIVAQIGVQRYQHDTGGSLYQRVREVEKTLFLKYWPHIVGNTRLLAWAQQAGGSYHSKRDFFELKESADLASMSGSDLVRLIGCLTFPGYTGLKVILGRQAFRAYLKLEGQE